MKIILFAGVAEAAGTPTVELAITGQQTVKQIKEQLVELFPNRGMAEKLALCYGAVNHTYCSDDTVVEETDELAIIPPVSGG